MPPSRSMAAEAEAGVSGLQAYSLTPPTVRVERLVDAHARELLDAWRIDPTDLKGSGSYGWSAFHWASQRGNVCMLEWLWYHEACDMISAPRRTDGLTPVSRGTTPLPLSH